MKKSLFFILFLFISSLIFAEQKETKSIFTNTFGADENSISDTDLFTLSKTKTEDEFSNKKDFLFSDRIQYDYSSEKISGRLRLDLSSSTKEAATSSNSLNFRFKGYFAVEPLQYLSIAVGNSFFNKFALSGAELFASDDFPSYGKYLKSGLGFSGGFNINKLKIKLSSGVDADLIYSDFDELNLNFGAEMNWTSLFSFGCVLQNATSYNRKAAAFVSLNPLKEFTFNFGYIYNNTDEDFLPVETLHSVQVSSRGEIPRIKLYMAFDLICALSDQFRKGEEIYSYKDDSIPFYFDYLIGWNANSQIKTEFNFKYTTIFNSDNSSVMEFYPKVIWNLPGGKDKVIVGIRLKNNQNISTGINEVGFPLTWKHKF